MIAQAFNSSRGRWISVGLMSAWCMKRIPGQTGLIYTETLSQNKNKNTPTYEKDLFKYAESLTKYIIKVKLITS
jgi:sugar phosphate permease